MNETLARNFERTRYCLSMGVLLISWTAAAVSQTPPPDTLTLVHVSDTHLCNLDSYHPLFVQARQHYGHGAEGLRRFFTTIPGRVDADAVVITGDLVDYFKAETPAGHMLAAQIEQFVDLFELSPVPLFLTLGNHDINSYWVESADSTIKQHQIDAGQARAAWIRNLACFRNGTYYARDFVVGDAQFRLLFLDNGYSLQAGMGLLDETQLDWLRYQVENAADARVVLFMHRYIPVGDKNGDGLFFKENRLDWPDQESCSTGLLSVLNENKNIRAIIVGHGHRNVIEEIDLPAGHKVIQCETAAFGADEDNWRLLQFSARDLTISAPGSRVPAICFAWQ